MNIFTWTVLYLIMPIPVLLGAAFLFERIAGMWANRGVVLGGQTILPTWLNALLTLPILGIFWIVLSRLPYSVKGYYAKDQAAADEPFNVRLAPLMEWWPLAVAILVYVIGVVVVGAIVKSRWLPQRISFLDRELWEARKPVNGVRRAIEDEWVWESETPYRISSGHGQTLRPLPPKPSKGPGGRWVKRR